MSAASIRLALALALAGCSGSSEEPARPAPRQADAPAKAAAQKPYGADAYTGRREVKTEGLGAATDGTLLAATDGAELALSSIYQKGPAVVIFYRGHW